ncbi:MAG: DEAD/DEAH box helicase [Chloroflexi bacterium AL-W]|nr:DEAD/DEAH box helicase [Chloroflexi bacterium AL-N1]NOK69498.1 DEAD/DEAH box helicase [Chloroflexi bacterium AL-N10]NOK77463.1 DEAD/DEAH box helicase [Chloroflexi bacterium AL-N5]NOK84314.1 DEAD/DEAH box helicase [Chloroflexi bacterium AL-W]NOK91520.1 DEAD/DEAH box helicase [Chloroflexi bacterium AL-N15]
MLRQRELTELFIELDDGGESLLDASLDETPVMQVLAKEVDETDVAGSFRTKLALTPRPYQEDALASWLAADGQGVVVLPTGAGKTILALMAIERLKLRTLIVVPTIELLYQWRDTIMKHLGVAKKHVGVVGDGRREFRPITIITYASAAMPEAPLAETGLLICDEAHHLPSPSYSVIPQRCGAPYRLGITATPERSDGSDHLLHGLLGPTVYQCTPAQLAALGHLAKFREKRIYVDLQPEEAIRYGVLMTEWKWFVARNRGHISRGGDFFGELIRRSGNDPVARQALRAHHQARMIALNAEAKMGEVAGLLAQHRDDKVLIFSEYTALVDRISHAFALPAITYRTAADERKHILQAFRNGAYSKLVAGRVLNEGVDIPDANVAIVVSGNSTAREHIQRLGRVIRPKQTEALLYELVTRHTSEVNTARKRRKTKDGRRKSEAA